MNNMELETDIEALDMEMGDITIHYCPVIPNPEGEPTAELKTADIEGTIYKIVDEEARTELENKVDKVEGKDLSTNDYTDEDKAIVDGVTEALNGKVDKDGDKVLSDNNYSDEDKAIVDGVTSALDGKADKSDTYTKLEVDSALDNKVDKVNGKGLSENDFTDTLKDKLDGIEAEANKTVVDNSVTATSTNPVESKAIYNLLNDLLPEATETGNPISITNASGLNAKSLKVELEPIQDLHGYDSPWVGGAGKNKFDGSSLFTSDTINGITYTVNSDGSVKVSGTPTQGESNNIVSSAFTLPAGTYILSGSPLDSSNQNRDMILFNGTTVVARDYTGVGNSNTFTLSETTTLTLRLRCYNTETPASSYNYTYYPMIRLSSVADDTFVPYSNICPISGRTQTVVSVNSEDTTIPFNQTVYGGEVDVTSGGTSDEWGYITLDGTQFISQKNWRPTENGVGWIYQYALTNNEVVPSTAVAHLKSDKLETVSYSDLYNGAIGISVYSSNSLGICVRYPDTSLSTVSAINTFLSQNPITVCYKKATPTTINTPANEISLLKGANTLVADGEMELVYSKIPQ